MRKEYQIFLMYHHLDLYNTYNRLLLEPLSGIHCLQFQIWLSLVLIQKSLKKIVPTMCFIERVSCKKKGVSSAYTE